MNSSWIFLRSITTVYAIVTYIYIYTVRIYDIHVYIYIDTHVCIYIYLYICTHYIHYIHIPYHICMFWYVIYNVVMIWLLPICRDTQGAKSRWKFQYSFFLGWSSCELQSNAVIPGSSKKTAIHRKPQSYPAYPRNPQLQCCDRKCRTSSTEMAVFFEGRQTHNSEDNIELGDGGAWPLRCGTSWDGCFFWRARWGFFWFRVHFNCCWYACGCRSAHIHTHRCDNISVWNLRIVKACASVICDSPIKVDAKG